MTKKQRFQGLAALGIACVIYSVVVFALAFDKNSAAFWCGWATTLVAIAAQAYVMRVAFQRGQGVKSKFYGFPIARIGVLYLLAQVVLSVAFMAMADSVPRWLPVVCYAVLAGAAAVGLIAADAVRDEVERQEAVAGANTQKMRALAAVAGQAALACPDEQAKKAIERLAEQLRYSDPVSSAKTAQIEAQLEECMREMSVRISSGEFEKAASGASRALTLLEQRNALCRMGKR